MNTGMIPSGVGLDCLYGEDSIKAARRENAAKLDREREEFKHALGKETDQKCPYGYLAKDGIVEYNGVIFTCEYKENALCLGDMTDSKKVLRISLPSGGSLKVNVDSIGSLQKAASMFSPEDLNAILRAIHEYNHCTKKLNEIEDEENKSPEDVAEEGAEEAGAEGPAKEPEYAENSLIQQISAYKTELYHKLLKGETEPKIQIGAKAMSVKEWNKLMEEFDKKQKAIHDIIKEESENERSRDIIKRQQYEKEA